MEKSAFNLVNWVQGMNVSSAHFIATENYFSEKMIQGLSVCMKEYAYGILSERKGANDTILSMEGRAEHAKVVLNSYRGITPGGVIINFDKEVGVECSCSGLDGVSEDGWNVVLTVAPYDRNPYGEPDMMETPPRYPFVEPSYRLNLMARLKNASDYYGPNSVIVGLLRKKDDSFVLDANYIPPTVSMSDNPDLLELHRRFSSYLADIKFAVSIVLSKALEQSNRTPLVSNIILVCKMLFQTLSALYFDWHNRSYKYSPYQVVEVMNRMASSFLTALAFLPRSEKEDLMNYFKEWNGIAPSSFEQMLDESISHSYNHNRIGESMLLLECVLKNMQELFVELSHLDIIGGRRKEDMVISFSDKQVDQLKGRESWLTSSSK